MSAFIVGDETIDRILSYLKTHNTQSIELKGVDITKFGRKLLSMNIDAVNQRYGGEYTGNEVKNYTFNMVDVSPVQAFKSLRCFLYQCSEGNVPKRKLYKTMDKLSDEISYEIVTSLPEYENGRWG